ncbi:hypothetical protein P20439_1269 [Pseudoalteromonas sp. BSi20439]|nr:hypothetical protein P20439_1269 [Pseudoalteromonas sp. BSi20439]
MRSDRQLYECYQKIAFFIINKAKNNIKELFLIAKNANH